MVAHCKQKIGSMVRHGRQKKSWRSLDTREVRMRL